MLKPCTSCKKLFNRTLGAAAALCSPCTSIEEDHYRSVYNYLRDYPGSDIQQVTEQTNVPRDTVARFFRDGRFQAADAPLAVAGTRCSSCAKAVTVPGKSMCAECANTLAQRMKASLSGGLSGDRSATTSPSPQPAPGRPASSRRSSRGTRYGLGARS